MAEAVDPALERRHQRMMTPDRRHGSKLRAVLFDHDGTLVDSEGVHCRLWGDVLDPHGIELSFADYQRDHAGIPTPANARDLVARHALSVTAAELAEAKNRATAQYLARAAFPLMPGVRETLAFCRDAGLRLAIVTGAGRNGVDATLRAHGLADFFEAIITGDDVVRSKPAPECYLLALSKLGLDATECLAIEDSGPGIEAAVTAGIACCGVRNAMSANHDFSRATEVFGSLAEVRRWMSARHAIEVSGHDDPVRAVE